MIAGVRPRLRQLDTSDTLNLSSSSQFSYSGDPDGGNFDDGSKSTTFASDGVVVCQQPMLQGS